MADEKKQSSITGHYKHNKLAENSRRTGGKFHVDSVSYPRVMSGGMTPEYETQLKMTVL